MSKKPTTRSTIKENQRFLRPFIGIDPRRHPAAAALLVETMKKAQQDENFRRHLVKEIIMPGIEHMTVLFKPYDELKEKVLDGLRTGDSEPLFHCLTYYGPRILLEPAVIETLSLWWLEKMDREEAKRNLRRIGEALSLEGSGTHRKVTEEDKRKIVTDCAKWLPLCQKLNKDFKHLWDNPAWQQRSREQEENGRDALARKHDISLEDVSTVERFLLVSSQQGKATPWEATMELVGEKYHVGAGTVEKIYRDFQNAQPEYKKRKTPAGRIVESLPSSA